jgi:epoxyqueuosine reductase
MPPASERLRAAAIKAHAREIGFDLCGIAPADDMAGLGFLREWIDRGYAGEMHYLSRSADRRADVRAVLPSARAVIMLGTLYNTAQPYSTEVADAGAALVSRYAWGDDYHGVIEKRLEALVGWMRATEPSPFEARAYVDTGPIQERAYAQRAGLGWIGKNTCVINPRIGSWIFLAAVVCSLPLETDAPAVDQCGTCTLCLDACPTGAFPEPGVLDSTRCLSYLTIELKGSVPLELREAVKNHIYGCDVCQEVCPWNSVPPVSPESLWRPRPLLDGAAVAALWQLPDAELRRGLRDSAMARAGVRGLRRNLATALGNGGTPGARRLLEDARNDEARPSVSHPVVAEHVEWALRRDM